MTNLELASTSIAFAVLALYIALCLLVRRRLPSSVSETYYWLERKWLFSAVIVTTAILTLVPWLNLGGDFQCFAFLSCAAMVFVGATPAFKEDFVGKVHTGSAIVLFISVTSWLWTTIGVPWIILGFTLLALIDRKRLVWWIEIGLILNLYGALLLT